MPTLQHYKVYIEIIQRGSMTAAARHLRCSLQSVSRALASLEDELGVELVRRTTRRLKPTATGLLFYERIKGALSDIDEACVEASLDMTRISGVLRIGAPVLFSEAHVAPVAASFLQRFPETEIELVLSDALADLVRDGLDIAIRIGELTDSTLKARRVAELRRVMVAAPSYLSTHGIPVSPSDLAHHRCVVRTFGPEGGAWPLTIGGRTVHTPVRGVFRCNDASSANAAVMHGMGIGMSPFWQVRQAIDQGRLVLVLVDHEPPPLAVHALWPGSAVTPGRTRMFVDMLMQHLAAEPV